MKDALAPTCPLVAHHAELLAEEERLIERANAVRAERAGLEQLMRRVDDLRAMGFEIEIHRSADRSPGFNSRPGGASVSGRAPDAETAPVDRDGGGPTEAAVPADTRKRLSWSSADCARMQELVLRGLSWPEVAREMGRTATACRAKAPKIDGFVSPEQVKAAAHRIQAETERAAQQQVEAGLSVMKSAPAVAHSVPWTDEDDLKLMNGRAAGRSYAEIAADLGRSVKACNVRYARLSKPAEAMQ